MDTLQSTVALLIDKFDQFNRKHTDDWKQSKQKLYDVEQHLQKLSQDQQGKQFNLDRQMNHMQSQVQHELRSEMHAKCD